jgi:hypothetical protein
MKLLRKSLKAGLFALDQRLAETTLARAGAGRNINDAVVGSTF